MPEPVPASAAVLDAVVAVIAEQGLEGTSVRRVAARAGVSIGAVQHHFPTKDAMLAAAMAQVEALHREELAREVAGSPDSSPAATLRAAVRSLVPRDATENRYAALWLAFVARAAVHAGTAEHHRRTWQRAEDGIARLVTACQAGAGTSAADHDPGEDPPPSARESAAELLALADGLAISVLVEPDRMPPGRARALVDAAVDRVLVRLSSPGT